MEITKNLNNNVLEIALTGRLDTATAPQLDQAIKSVQEPYDSMVFDFSSLDYISSAGLRVLLSANKYLTGTGNGPITIKNANDIVKEVFEVTGFDTIVNME